MNAKKDIIKKSGKWLCVVLLLFCSANYAVYSDVHSPFENSNTTINNGTFSTSSSDNGPFGNSNPLRDISKSSDRPMNGEGIGQVPVKGNLVFLLLLAIAYGLLARFDVIKKYSRKKQSN